MCGWAPRWSTASAAAVWRPSPCENAAGRPTEVVPAYALFLLIGAEPRTGWLHGRVAMDDRGYLLTGLDALGGGRSTGWPARRSPMLLETRMPGVFAAGDVRHRSIK